MPEATPSTDAGWLELDAPVAPGAQFPVRASAGGEPLVLLKAKGVLRGIEPTCPHQGASWLKGTLMGNDTMIRCPLHSYIFRLSDGNGVNCPGNRVTVYETAEMDGRLLVRKVAAK